MSPPIVLWNAKRRATHGFDDAGISITKTILPPPGPRAPYDVDREPPKILKAVPPLAYFCIRALTPHVDQLHHLQHTIPYNMDIVNALVRRTPASLSAKNKDSQPFHVSTVDPRLLATLGQVMHPLPEEFRDYDIPLSDVHLPLLQRVPSRGNFCFITVLALPYCKELCDDTIGVIRCLNTLTALDIRGTTIGSYGLTVLARGLSWSDDDLQSRTGCWGLRILSLHSCTNIGNDALPILSNFPLLSCIDLRFTGCTQHAVSKHLADAGFRPSSNRLLFYPVPSEISLKQLENLGPTSMYSCGLTSVFKLHINKLNHSNVFSEDRTPPYILRNMREGPISLIDFADEENGEPAEPTSQNVQARMTSTFYASRLPRRENLIRAAVEEKKEQLRPLALARPPPQWSVLDALRPPVRQQQPYGPKEEPLLPRLESMDRSRLTKRTLSSVEGMVATLADKNKKRKVESAFASARVHPISVTKSKNPFAKSGGSTSKSNRSSGMVRSVFAEQRDAVTASAPVKQGLCKAEPWPKFCDGGPLKPLKTSTPSTSSSNTASNPVSSASGSSLLHDTSNPVKKDSKPPVKAKILRPITSYPVPPCPPEHFLLVPQIYPKNWEKSKGTAPAVFEPFPDSIVPMDGSDDIIEVEGIGSIHDDDPKSNERSQKKAGRNRGGTNSAAKKGRQKATEFDWDKWRRKTM
ncbi:uncharacterized protein EDB93DRAFT_1255174 [Suillus bovinus]|uniref:uncharacterized protein n=1 Tax=Suillus bovinus TaxID=48563 RepID=UPI001B8701EE|nr:uncharacterized protein EDB93DRAFT_1255174 [Suillus bovinus]KAG2132502.1 hypothetical protein EDB93DRAFT_1255174 [Suillus bovinus]